MRKFIAKREKAHIQQMAVFVLEKLEKPESILKGTLKQTYLKDQRIKGIQ